MPKSRLLASTSTAIMRAACAANARVLARQADSAVKRAAARLPDGAKLTALPV